MNPLKHTSVLVKGLVIVVLALVPMGYLMNELIKSQNVSIEFAHSEQAGSHMLASVNSMMSAAVHGRVADLHHEKDAYTKLDTEISALNKSAVNSPLLSAETLKAFNDAADIQTRIDRAVDVVGEVADKSNLTLDPDMDTYYTMDTLTVKLPSQTMEMSDVNNILTASIASGALTPEQKTALTVKRVLIHNYSEGMKTNADKSFSGNPDGKLKPVLDTAYNDNIAKADSVLKLVDTAIAQGPTAINEATLNADYDAYVKASESLLTGVSSELDRMLQKRIDGFEDGKRNVMLVTAALVVGTLFILFVITSSITRPLAQVSKALESIAREETDVAVPGTDRRDEIGAIARASESLRKSVAESFRLKQIVEQMPMGIITLDVKNGGKINYANRMSAQYFKEEESHLSVLAADIIGAGVDIFYKDPTKRPVLSDARNMPYRDKIKIGPNHYNMVIDALRDKKNDYIGATLTWNRVTQQVAFADNIEKMVTAAVQEVAESAQSIDGSAKNLGRVADETKQLSAAVAAASTQAAQTSSQVAASAEELTASISEISSKIQQSSKVANEASNKGHAINEAMKSLAEKAARVSEVVNVITGIAEQTNLLALNATIEAARAGEAGKGFAVVASEVKSLANQTAKATEEVTSQIGEMQGATTLAVDSVKEIISIIGEISAHTTAVAAAVEEQSAATNEIARNISQTATGTQEISENIVLVERGADDTGKTSNEVTGTVGTLTMQLDALQDKIGEFLKSMRTAA